VRTLEVDLPKERRYAEVMSEAKVGAADKAGTAKRAGAAKRAGGGGLRLWHRGWASAPHPPR
jgi:hypothetical protein